MTVARWRFLQQRASLYLLGLLFVCLICPVNPQSAEAHHAESSAPDRACGTVAEAARVIPAYSLVGAPVVANQNYFPVLSALVLPVVLGWGGRTIGATPPSENPFTNSSKLYRLHCIYRL